VSFQNGFKMRMDGRPAPGRNKRARDDFRVSAFAELRASSWPSWRHSATSALREKSSLTSSFWLGANYHFFALSPP